MVRLCLISILVFVTVFAQAQSEKKGKKKSSRPPETAAVGTTPTDPMDWQYIREGFVCKASAAKNTEDLAQEILMQIYSDPKEVVLQVKDTSGNKFHRKIPAPFQIVSIAPNASIAQYGSLYSVCVHLRSTLRQKLESEVEVPRELLGANCK